jgi:hypothetical protein
MLKQTICQPKGDFILSKKVYPYKNLRSLHNSLLNSSIYLEKIDPLKESTKNEKEINEKSNFDSRNENLPKFNSLGYMSIQVPHVICQSPKTTNVKMRDPKKIKLGLTSSVKSA